MTTWLATLVGATALVFTVTALVGGDEHSGHLGLFVLMCVTLAAAIWDGRRRGLAFRRASEG
jgi:hypothetical protein